MQSNLSDMSVNNNNPTKDPVASSPSLTGSSGYPPPAAGFPGQFSLSQAQARARAQSLIQAQFQAQLQAHGISLNPNLPVPGNANNNAGGKRFLPKPPIHPVGFNAVPPAARKKKQKLSEKRFHEKVAAILPESALYTQLLEFESSIDAALDRKKVDIQEALKNPPCIEKTLRIYVFNTFANQNQNPTPGAPNAEPPTWTLKIVGRILEHGESDHPAAVHRSASPLYPKFSAFFKRVTIYLDKKLYPDNNVIVWENSRSAATHEGFEVKRKGDTEFSAHIRLELNYVPEKFMLSPALCEVLGTQVDTRPRIVAAIWHYVKARRLQNTNDPSFFHCDQALQKVFGEDKVKFTMVPQKISPHLFPPQVVLLEHKIKLSGNSPAGSASYDVTVDIPFPIQRDLSALLANMERNKEIDACDESICGIIRKIHEHRRRRAFFLGFTQSPVEFINALIESQNKDLKIVAGESGQSDDKERRLDFVKQPWVEDAIIRYLNRKQAAGGNTPGST